MVEGYENWEELQRLFHLAELSREADLDCLLKEACDDPEIRARALRLIVASRNFAQTPDPESQSSVPSRRIGPYTIVRLLGSGGIGSVYLGERLIGGAVQRVALKVLARSAVGPGFTERFAREQYILASLSHVNIARMLDAGVAEDGEPYLVMEYVEGEHLDTWCDKKKLGIAERLRLFLKICEAVAYAHRNLVVHLDLKPANILIASGDGSVKLLDFGTSKLVRQDSLLTTTVMATPAYASPEQLLNRPVTTACDIYALGVILFELLSGRRPNGDASMAMLVERAMREMHPEPLNEVVTLETAELRATSQTRLRAELSGDLVTIVTKCLAPQPKDRYLTVDALEEDVQRYLSGRPILARPQTKTYRVAKFVRRNRGIVLTITLAAVALITTGAYAAWRQHQAVLAGRRAQQMQGFIYRLFRIANTYYVGKPTATVDEFLQLGVKVLPDFVFDPGDLRAAQLSLAESMYDNSDYKGAQDVLRHVIASAQAAGDIPSEAEAESYAGDIEYTIGSAQKGLAFTSHALSLSGNSGVSPSVRVRIKITYAANQEETSHRSEDNLRMMRSAIAEARKEHLPARELALAQEALADSLEERGLLPEAKALYLGILQNYSSQPYAACDEAGIHKKLGIIQGQQKDFAGALELYRRASVEARQCAGPDDLETLSAQAYVASAMLKLNRTKAAIAMLEDSLPSWKKVVGPGSSHMATPLLMLSRGYLQDGQFVNAERTIRQTIEAQHEQKPLSSVMGTYYLVLTKALLGEGRNTEALESVRHAEAAFAAEDSKGPSLVEQAKQAHQIELELTGDNGAQHNRPSRIPLTH